MGLFKRKQKGGYVEEKKPVYILGFELWEILSLMGLVIVVGCIGYAFTYQPSPVKPDPDKQSTWDYGSLEHASFDGEDMQILIQKAQDNYLEENNEYADNCRKLISYNERLGEILVAGTGLSSISDAVCEIKSADKKEYKAEVSFGYFNGYQVQRFYFKVKDGQVENKTCQAVPQVGCVKNTWTQIKPSL